MAQVANKLSNCKRLTQTPGWGGWLATVACAWLLNACALTAGHAPGPSPAPDGRRAAVSAAPGGDAQAPATQAIESEFERVHAVLMGGDYRAGLAELQPLLARSQAQLGPAAPATLKVHYYLASTLLRLGRLGPAKDAFEDIGRRHREAGSAHSRSAISSLAGLARVVEALQSVGDALPIYREAMALRSRVLGEDDLESVTLLDDYAVALVESGAAFEALPMLDRALALRTAGLGAAHRWTLTTRGNRAHAYNRLGRLAEALADNEAVLKQRLPTLGERDPTTLSTMNNTANVLGRLGRHAEALALYEWAVAVRREQLGAGHPSTLASRRGAATQLLALGHAQQAVLALRALVEESQAAWGAGHFQTRAGRELLARALSKVGPLESALDAWTEAQAQDRTALGDDHFDTLSVGIQRARVLRRMGRAVDARSALQRLVQTTTERYGARAPLALDGTAELAASQLDSGDAAAAAAAMAQVLADADGADNDIDPDSEIAPALLERHAGWRRLQARALAEQGRLAPAFEAIEAYKSARLLGMLGDRQAAASAGVTREELSRLQSLREQVQAARDNLQNVALAADRQRALQTWEAANLAVSGFKAALRARYPLYARLTRPSPATVGDAARLPAGALLVSYVVEDDERISALTLDARGTTAWQQLGRLPGLAQSVESLRLWSAGRGRRWLQDDSGGRVEIVHWQAEGGQRWRAVRHDATRCDRASEDTGCWPATAVTVHSEADYHALCANLAATLLEPMRTVLGRHRQWVISPDAGLGALPFDVLPWRGASVARSVALSQVASLSMWRATRDARPGAAGRGVDHALDLVAIGNPGGGQALPKLPAEAVVPAQPRGPTAIWSPTAEQPGSGAATDWPPLQAAQAEMEGVAALFPAPRVQLTSGADATESRLRALSAAGVLARARYLLLSTHAWYSPEHPGRSHVVLRALGDAAEEDGRMTAVELAGLQLRSDLAVISACNSARADAASADGQFGFAYGLGVAGNRNSVLTWWPVGDAEAAHFVHRLFSHLRRGASHAQALQRTKLEFMHHPRPALRQPRVWAAFALFGA